MEFTEDELKMIAHLKMQHSGWKTIRIIILVGSVFLIAMGIYEINSETPSPNFFDFVIFFGLAAAGLSYSVGGWAGRPEISLLLKLIEDRQKQTIIER